MACELENNVLIVETNFDRIVLLQQHALQQVCGLLGQNERCSNLRLSLSGVAHQLVSISTYEGGSLGLDIDEYAVHYGAQLIVSRCENGLIDTCDQSVNIELNLLLILGQCRQCRIAHTRYARDRRHATIPADFDLPGRVVYLDCKGHFGELFERVEHQSCGSCNYTLLLNIVNLDAANQSGFEIRSGNLQTTIAQLEQEIVENGQLILIADNFTRGCQQRQQGRT